LKQACSTDCLKTACAIVIVGAAVCIMAPGLLAYAAGLGRLAIWIAAVIAVAAIAGIILARLKSKQNSKESNHAQE